MPSTSTGLRLRVASINTAGFLVASLSATFLDGQFTTHVLWGARTYPLGYYIACFAPIFFVTTYVVLAKWERWPALAAWLPSALLAVPFLWNFQPELPHSGYIFDLADFLFLSFITVFLAKVAEGPQASNKARFPRAVNIRRLEEAIKDWRGILVISMTTYIIILIYWMQLIWQLPGMLLTDRAEKWIFGNTLTAKAVLFSLFVLVGPIAEIVTALRSSQAQLFEAEARPAGQAERESSSGSRPPAPGG